MVRWMGSNTHLPNRLAPRKDGRRESLGGRKVTAEETQPRSGRVDKIPTCRREPNLVKTEVAPVDLSTANRGLPSLAADRFGESL